MNQDFWKNKRVLLTGHTGFKGSWLSIWLQMAGARLTGYSLPPPTTPSLFVAAHVAQGMTSVIGDVRDLDHLRDVVQEYAPEIVIHMAAQSLVRLSYMESRDTFATNVMGTVNLLEAIKAVGGVKVFINVTTDKCYQNREWLWGYRENESLGGYDPYSSSKACSEIVTSAYRSSFFNPSNFASHGVAIATARAGNVIGGGDWASDRLMSDIVRAAVDGSVVKIRNPEAIRPWQHVLEALYGYTLLAERLWQNGQDFSEAWNFGPLDLDAKPVSWILRLFSELWPTGLKFEIDESEQPHEARYLRLDCSKARMRLGYATRLTLPIAIEWLVEWQKDYQEDRDTRAITEKQISRYNQTLPSNH